MLHVLCIFVGALFFVLTPGILVTLPPKGSKVVVALTHAFVFAVVYCLTHKMVYQYFYEGFEAVGGPAAQACAAATAAAAAKPDDRELGRKKAAACLAPGIGGSSARPPSMR